MYIITFIRDETVLREMKLQSGINFSFYKGMITRSLIILRYKWNVHWICKNTKIEIRFSIIWWKIFFRPLINLHSCLLKVNNDHANCDIIGNELFNSRQTGKNKANEEINFTVQKIFNTQQKWSPTWQRKIRHGIINILPSKDV